MYTSQLSYVSDTGDTVELDGLLLYVGTALGIRGRTWDYSLGRRNIKNQIRSAREAKIDVHYLTLSEADRARRVFDRDVWAGTPGCLVSTTGYEQRAYIIEQEPEDRYQNHLSASLTVLLLDGVWRKLEITEFKTGSLGKSTTDYGKAYNYDWEYDYAPPSTDSSVLVDSPVACAMRLVIHGYVENPRIVIGGNVYLFNVEVPTGSYLVVDTRPDPTVTLYSADGRETDVFSCAVRGSGEGSGQYAFELLQPGAQLVDWDNSFGFELGVYLEEGEIPWT